MIEIVHGHFRCPNCNMWFEQKIDMVTEIQCPTEQINSNAKAEFFETAPADTNKQGHYEDTGEVGANGKPIRRWVESTNEEQIKSELYKGVNPQEGGQE